MKRPKDHVDALKIVRAWKKKIAKKSAKPKLKKIRIVNMKTGGKDRKALVAKAKRYAKGNLSAWLRHAGLKHVPKKGEKVSLAASK